MLIIHKNCDKNLAKDKTLPRNSYLVTYEQDEELVYDIVQCSSKVQIFDYYYDRYGNVLKDIRWTEGTVNPKCYQSKSKK